MYVYLIQTQPQARLEDGEVYLKNGGSEKSWKSRYQTHKSLFSYDPEIIAVWDAAHIDDDDDEHLSAESLSHRALKRHKLKDRKEIFFVNEKVAVRKIFSVIGEPFINNTDLDIPIHPKQALWQLKKIHKWLQKELQGNTYSQSEEIKAWFKDGYGNRKMILNQAYKFSTDVDKRMRRLFSHFDNYQEDFHVFGTHKIQHAAAKMIGKINEKSSDLIEYIEMEERKLRNNVP